MQYKTNTKIIIDKRKLDILIRLGCPDDRLLSVLKTGKFDKTGDNLIDENLETLTDIKDFKNWGGKRLNSGKKKKISNQVEKQLENQVGVQVVDKDKDIDKDIDNIKERGYRGKPTLQDVIDYCNERNNGVDAEKWFDYYTANGWKVGRNPMRDWRATVRTWEKKTKVAEQPSDWMQELIKRAEEGGY